jgi:phage tail sheath protein FI
VYIQEVESPVHTVTPVATSTTAFVGRAKRGPDGSPDGDGPELIHSFGDFQRIFGGLWADSPLGYAVNDFFLNGGSDAVIVRLHNGAKAATITMPAGGGTVALQAQSKGAWGNKLRVRVEYVLAPGTAAADPTYKMVAENVAKPLGVADPTELFNLYVYDGDSGTTEKLTNITANTGVRTINKVLAHESSLVACAAPETPWVAKPTASGSLTKPNKPWWDDDNAGGFTPADANSGSDGGALQPTDYTGDPGKKTGIYALENADIFNLLVIPPDTANGDTPTDPVLTTALAYCERKRAILLVDPPSGWARKDNAKNGVPISGLGPSANAAIYFPRIRKADPLHQNQIETFVPSGTVAGIIARTDLQRGVWKAPAGLEATMSGVASLTVPLTDAENGELNPLGINCLRTLPAAGNVVWGARTTVGDDRLSSQWKYLPVRRTALWIEETLYRSSQWAVFEPNDEPLWSALRLNIGAFMQGLFRQGAFQGQSPKDAYFVQCDSTTTTQADIDRGIVNIVVGFAPLKPAEFVVIYIQQIAGNIAT